MSSDTEIDARLLADRLGRRAMQERLGVGRTAVGNAVQRGCFPADWFLVVQAMCAEAELECPPELFRMKADSRDADAAPSDQGARDAEHRGDPPVAAE